MGSSITYELRATHALYQYYKFELMCVINSAGFQLRIYWLCSHPRVSFNLLMVHRCYVIFFTVKLPDGTVIAELSNAAVPQYILREIFSWRQQGISMRDIVARLRPRTVPPGYPYHTWKTGKDKKNNCKQQTPLTIVLGHITICNE